jgi:hypothetical protein
MRSTVADSGRLNYNKGPAPTSTLFGVRVVESRFLEDRPVLQLDPEFKWCSDEFRAKQNKWLLDMFGTQSTAYLIDTKALQVAALDYEKVEARILALSPTSFAKLKTLGILDMPAFLRRGKD